MALFLAFFFLHRLPKTNMKDKNGGPLQMLSFCKWVTFGFHVRSRGSNFEVNISQQVWWPITSVVKRQLTTQIGDV